MGQTIKITFSTLLDIALIIYLTPYYVICVSVHDRGAGTTPCCEKINLIGNYISVSVPLLHNHSLFTFLAGWVQMPTKDMGMER